MTFVLLERQREAQWRHVRVREGRFLKMAFHVISCRRVGKKAVLFFSCVRLE